MQPYPWSPHLVWPGHLHGMGCLSARAMDNWVSYCCVALVFGSEWWLGLGFGCAPPLLAGVLGRVCACVCAPLVPCHSWLGCAVCVCVEGFGFRLRPATLGWGVRVCVCLCARFACTPPLLPGMCGVGVKVLPWVVVGAGGLGAGKTSGAGTRGVSLDVVIGCRTGHSDTNGGESSDNRSKVHADCGPAENPSL